MLCPLTRVLFTRLEMGALTSRQNIGVEEVDIPSNSVYRYPPKSGKSPDNRSLLWGQGGEGGWGEERGCGHHIHVSLQMIDCVIYEGGHQNHQLTDRPAGHQSL